MCLYTDIIIFTYRERERDEEREREREEERERERDRERDTHLCTVVGRVCDRLPVQAKIDRVSCAAGQQGTRSTEPR